LQNVQVHYVAGLRIDLTLDRQVQLVIVPMEVGTIAHAERLPVPLIGELGVVHSMRGIEVHAPGHATTGHRPSRAKSLRKMPGPAGRSRRPKTRTPTGMRS